MFLILAPGLVTTANILQILTALIEEGLTEDEVNAAMMILYLMDEDSDPFWYEAADGWRFQAYCLEEVFALTDELDDVA